MTSDSIEQKLREMGEAPFARERMREILQSDRYQDGKSPHNTVKPRHGSNRPGRDTTEVAVMPSKSNDLHVRVSYATDCPEWWRIQIRRRIGRTGLATRQECVDWLYRYGSSQDDDLWLQWEAWQNAAAEGEEVEDA